MDSTVTPILMADSTVAPILLTDTTMLPEEPDYTDEQFYADLEKAGKKLDAMEKKASREHARGKTRKFPV